MCYKEAKFKSDWGLKCSTALHKLIWLLVNVGNDLFLSSLLRGYCSAQVTDSLFCTVFVFFPDLEGILCIKRGECFYLFHYNETASQTTFQGTWNFSLFLIYFDLQLGFVLFCLFVFNPINKNHTFKYDILLVCYILTGISNRRNLYRVCNVFALKK